MHSVTREPEGPSDERRGGVDLGVRGRGRPKRPPGSRRRWSQVWQGPLLLTSLGLFGYAGYLLIDPQPGLGVSQRLEVAETLLRQDRADGAIERLADVLRSGPLKDADEGRARLLLAEAIELAQRQRGLDVPANHVRVIEQTRLAFGKGADGDLVAHRRLARSYAALRQRDAALEHYRHAIVAGTKPLPRGEATGPESHDVRDARVDPAEALSTHRELIDFLVSEKEPVVATAELATYLRSRGLTNAERAWALGRRAKLLADAGKFADARALLDEASRLAVDPVEKGVLNYHLGYAAYKLGDADEAERLLRVCREQLGIRHPLDAEACLLLGRLLNARGESKSATSFFQIVLTSHPDSVAAPLARLGRGVARVAGDDVERPSGVEDLRALARTLHAGTPSTTLLGEAIAGLRSAGRALADRADYAAALDLAAHERLLYPVTGLSSDQAVGDDAPPALPPAEFLARLGTWYERRAEQLGREAERAGEASASSASSASASGRPASDPAESDPAASETVLAVASTTREEARRHRRASGDAWVSHAQAVAGSDDAASRASLWKGIDLYESAGDPVAAAHALERFVVDRPADPLAPDALLRLGLARAAAGETTGATEAFRRVLMEYPRSIAASRAAVPLARAYLTNADGARGADAASAEQVLLTVVRDNPQVTPASRTYRDAVRELGTLYYAQGRWDEAVARLDEFAQRYPEDERTGGAWFLVGESHRKAAASALTALSRLTTPAGAGEGAPGALVAADRPADTHEDSDRDAVIASAGPNPASPGLAPEAAALVTERQTRLDLAREAYDATLAWFADTPPAGESDRLYQKLAFFYRADCVYDLGDYERAIRLYDEAATRYQDDPTALAAYVQIVNAHVALGRPEAARVANERAKWLLRRIPADRFAGGDGVTTLPRDAWERWLDWGGTAGLAAGTTR